MKLHMMFFALLCVLFAGSAMAHGSKVHVRGTIDKVNSDSIVVKTPDGKSVEVKLIASTIYLLHVIDKSTKPSDTSEDKPAKVGDLAAGELVVIHATPKDNTLEADEVKFSWPTATKPAPPKQKS